MFSWFHATVGKPGFRGISTFLVFFQGGFYLLNLIDNYVGGFPLLFSGMFEIIAIIYIYGKFLCCKTFYICGIKFSRFNKNDILAYFNFGGHDIPWLQMVKKI